MNLKSTSEPAPEPAQKPTRTRFTSIRLGIFFGIAFGLVVGTLLTLGLVTPFNNDFNGKGGKNTSDVRSKNAESEPLYWVAPMDANYRRDKPGQSPMGMDLIPYYGNTNQSNNSQGSQFDEGPGTIKISPSVVNNLGVRTVIATRKALNNKIKTVGYVSYDEEKLIHIHPRVEGWIEKLHIQAVGDPVEQGQALYDIYSPELVNAQEELLLALARKNNRLISAAQNRLVALQLPSSAITRLKQTKKVQQFVTFYAPENGVVESLVIREGFYVKPETMMLSIVDLSNVWLKAEIFEKDIAKITMGNPAIMHLDYFPAREWTGEVSHVHPMLNPTTRTGIVRLHFDNTDRYLKPNMLAQITINVSDNTPVLQIPREALIRTGNQDRVVLALGDGYFKSVAVKVGRFDNNHVEIIAGLQQGETIVSSAQFLLDSESSKSSDFKRMDTVEDSTEAAVDENTKTKVNNEPVSSATVHGRVISVMTDHRMVTINREAIKQWNRPAASVDFIVDASVDMTVFTIGTYLMFTFEIRDGEFIITRAMIMAKKKIKADNEAEQGHSSQSSHSHSAHSHQDSHIVEEGMNKVYTK